MQPIVPFCLNMLRQGYTSNSTLCLESTPYSFSELANQIAVNYVFVAQLNSAMG